MMASDGGEEFTDIIGGHGRWQMILFFFAMFCSAPHCFHNLIMAFFAPNIDHFCAPPTHIIEANISLEVWKNTSIPWERNRFGHLEQSKCTFLNSSIADGVIKTSGEPLYCRSWIYDTSFYKDTMVDQFDLVCHRQWLISVSKTVYMVAFLVAATTSGQLSDRFGRRPVVMACLSVFIVAGFLTLLARDFITFIILRFFVALGLTSTFTISYVMLCEVVSVEYRSHYCFLFKNGWVFAYMLMPLIAWLLPGWFWLQLAVTLPWISLLCGFFVLPETPRWLLTHGKYEELENTLIKAANKNGKDPKQSKIAIQAYIAHQKKIEQFEKKGNETVLDLLRTPAMRKNTLNIYFCWLIISYIYYALSWNTNDLGGDPYWTFFASGAVELPAGIMWLYLCRYAGHRHGLMLANILAGLCLLGLLFVPDDMAWLTITFSMAGKFFNSASFDVVYIYTAEIFPTVVRNVAVGSSSTWARVGALVAPFIRQVADVTHWSVPIVIPGVLSILSGLLVTYLPDTKGKKVPDTIEEGEEFAKGKRKVIANGKEGCCKNGFELEPR